MKKGNGYLYHKNLQRKAEKISDIQDSRINLKKLHNIFSAAAQKKMLSKGDFFFKSMAAWEVEQLKKYGFYIHLVFDEQNMPNNTNIHTHGIQSNFNHPDLQICLPLSKGQALSVIHSIVEKIKSGESFKTDVEYVDILAKNYKLKFIKAIECGREVLRVILPDIDNQFDSPGFIDQFDMLSNE